MPAVFDEVLMLRGIRAWQDENCAKRKAEAAKAAIQAAARQKNEAAQAAAIERHIEKRSAGSLARRLRRKQKELAAIRRQYVAKRRGVAPAAKPGGRCQSKAYRVFELCADCGVPSGKKYRCERCAKRHVLYIEIDRLRAALKFAGVESEAA